MAIVPMQKVAVVAHKSKQEDLLQFLQKEGVLEITNMRDPTPVDHSEVHFRSAELEYAIQKLTEVASKDTLAAAQKKSTEEEVMRAVEHTDARGIIDELHKIEHDIGELTRIRESLTKEEEKAPAAPLAMEDVNAAEEPAYFNKTKRLKEDLSHYGLTYVHGKKKNELDAQAVELMQKDIDRKTGDLHKRLVQLSHELPNLLRVQQFIRWLDEKQAAREALVQTKHTVTLFGWVHAKLFATLEKKLHKQITASAMLKVKPEDDEEPPVLIDNPKWIKPFESVTTLYGLPLAAEMDPTPLLAPFFILFFGLCLTDAGYGITLAIIMGAYLFRSKKTISEAPLWWLLFISGIFTFLVSIPFGGWFGLSPQQAQSFAPWAVLDTNGDGVADMFKGQIWNLGDTKGITFFQNLSIVLGLAHLSFGMFLAGYSKLRNKDVAGAFWQDATSLILIGTGILYVFAPADMKQTAFYALIAATVLLVWGKGQGKAWYVRPLFGLLGLMNFVLGMLSNTLSYLRLLALGLVTGALALAVNLVAQQVSGLLPIYIGIPVGFVIIVAGHIVNIALNTMGAFIHSGRLQFVEFFSQFFEGGGRPFRPFTRGLGSQS